MKEIIVDTNVLLRFLVDDKSVLGKKADEFIKKAQKGKYVIKLNELIIAECLWVLISHYKYSKEKAVKALRSLILHEEFKIRDKMLINESMNFFLENNISWVDSYLYCQAKGTGLELVTFDEKLARLSEEA